VNPRQDGTGPGGSTPTTDVIAALGAVDTQLSLTDLVRQAKDTLEAEAIRRALAKADGNKAAAARALQIDYTTLHRKLKKHGLLTTAERP
jgi:two-component system nitrogen regulation response regulator GlnG